MKNLKVIMAINVGLILIVLIWQIFSKETILKNGKLVLLELIPVDPRSLMQGDYMNLRYAISSGVVMRTDSSGQEYPEYIDTDIPSRGYLVVRLNEEKVAQYVRVQKENAGLKEGEMVIKYFSDRKMGAESYFFQEGNAARFDSAKYGGLRVAEDGTSLLIGLYDGRKNFINP